MGHVTVEAELRRQRAGRKERIDLSLPRLPLFSLLHQRRLPQLFIAHAFQMVLVGHIARKRRSQIAQCLACFAERIGHAPGRDADIVRHRVEQVRLITQTVVERVGPELPLKLHRSEEHTSELQSLMRNSYAVFCLKKKKKT